MSNSKFLTTRKIRFTLQTLGDVIELKRGYDLPSKDRIPGQYPIISSSGISGTHSDYQVEGPGVVTGRYGTLGQIFYEKENFWPLNTTLYVKDFKGNHPKFIYYFLKTLDFWAFSDKAAVPGLNRNDLHTANILFSNDLHYQKSIAFILGSLDDKIDLNRRTNETLEAMARALFRDWFVDFGPTRAKMAGEASYLAPELWELFPDRLDDEGKPEGWEVCNFDELVNINPKEKLSKNTIAPYLSMSELPTQGCLAEAPISRPFSGGSKFRNGDTLFARITPCLENGKTALAQNLENNIVGWGSTEFHILRGKGNVPFSWVYLMARDNEFRTNAIRGMTGTSGRQRVASEVLATYKTVTPSGNQIWKAFDRACNPLFEKIIINGAESRTLAQLRDLLLPKLMTGEISIRDAEKMVEDAA